MAFQSKQVDLDLVILQFHLDRNGYLQYQTAMIESETGDLWENPINKTFSPDALPLEILDALNLIKDFLLNQETSEMTVKAATDSKIALKLGK